MRSSVVAALSGLALVNAQAPQPVPGVTGKLGDAKPESGNPVGVTYTAVLPDKPTTGVRGYISATSNADGTGAVFSVNFYGFPSLEEYGPFMYHVHDQPIPANGNCTAALAHLDPYVRGEVPPCYPANPASCQTGDLSGKHGNITTSAGLQTSYYDPYIALHSGPGAFIGNRSIVVHTRNATRLNCANFVLTSSAPNATNGTNATSVSPPTTPPTQTGEAGTEPFTGGAASNVVGATALVGVVVAAMAFFL